MRTTYETPFCEIIILKTEKIVATSPTTNGNIDSVSVEDWGVLN